MAGAAGTMPIGGMAAGSAANVAGTTSAAPPASKKSNGGCALRGEGTSQRVGFAGLLLLAWFALRRIARRKP
jgi:MYXO-CTERM domain-containing protein